MATNPNATAKKPAKKTDSLLVASSEIWVERDEDPVDNNDRLLRYVWYISDIDGQLHLLNEQLVAEGYAEAHYYAPNGLYQDRLDEAQDNAIREGRGMWTTCDASVSLDPALEDDNVPDTVPIDRTKIPVSDEEEVCSFFDTWDEANDFYEVPRSPVGLRSRRQWRSVRQVFRYWELITSLSRGHRCWCLESMRNVIISIGSRPTLTVTC